jgi:hypothetical protein
MDKSENPISLCVIHHRQNPIVSMSYPSIDFPSVYKFLFRKFRQLRIKAIIQRITCITGSRAYIRSVPKVPCENFVSRFKFQTNIYTSGSHSGLYRPGALEVGPFERVVRLFTIEVILD